MKKLETQISDRKLIAKIGNDPLTEHNVGVRHLLECERRNIKTVIELSEINLKKTVSKSLTRKRFLMWSRELLLEIGFTVASSTFLETFPKYLLRKK